MGDKIVVIEAAHYRETEDALVTDPVVKLMALELIQNDTADGLYSTLMWAAHQDEAGRWAPTSEFMNMSNAIYRKRGGHIQAHVGAVATAILRILDDRWKLHTGRSDITDMLSLPLLEWVRIPGSDVELLLVLGHGAKTVGVRHRKVEESGDAS